MFHRRQSLRRKAKGALALDALSPAAFEILSPDAETRSKTGVKLRFNARAIADCGRILRISSNAWRVVPMVPRAESSFSSCPLPTSERKTEDVLRGMGYDHAFENLAIESVKGDSSISRLRVARQKGEVLGMTNEAAAQLETELLVGDCYLEQVDGQLVRTVTLEAAHIVRKDGRILVQICKIDFSGNIHVGAKLPAMKRSIKDNPKKTLTKLLQDIHWDRSLSLRPTVQRMDSTVRASEAYSLMTRYVRNVHCFAVKSLVPEEESGNKCPVRLSLPKSSFIDMRKSTRKLALPGKSLLGADASSQPSLWTRLELVKPDLDPALNSRGMKSDNPSLPWQTVFPSGTATGETILYTWLTPQELEEFQTPQGCELVKQWVDRLVRVFDNLGAMALKRARKGSYTMVNDSYDYIVDAQHQRRRHV